MFMKVKPLSVVDVALFVLVVWFVLFVPAGPAPADILACNAACPPDK
jgi:hypothetical protein